VHPLLELPGGGKLGGLESEVLGRLSLSEVDGLPESDGMGGSLSDPLSLGGTITLPEGPSLLGPLGLADWLSELLEPPPSLWLESPLDPLESDWEERLDELLKPPTETETLPEEPLGEPLAEPLRERLLDPLPEELCEEEPEVDELLGDEELLETVTEAELEPLSELIDELTLLDRPLVEEDDALCEEPEVLESLLELELELLELLPSQQRQPSDR